MIPLPSDEVVQRLLQAARDVCGRAYAPYSDFRVGAAAYTATGLVFCGCNVENASYGLTICAERAAMFSAIAAGCEPGQITALAVIADIETPVSPCGACRQVMMELGSSQLIVIRANLRGAVTMTPAAELLPGSFLLPVLSEREQ